ncbi:MAG: ABC transporter substrate-binding protein, partial [Nitrososphaerales archaeon]
VYTSFSFILDTFDISLRAQYADEHFHLITFRDHPKMVYERIKNEVESGSRSADIVIGPHWMILNLQLNGLLRPYESPEFEAYPKEFCDPKGAWCAMALSPVGLAYNTNLISEEEAPKTLSDALDEKWRGKLAAHEITDNVEGQMGLTYLTALSRIMGEKRWSDFVGRLADMTPTTYQCMPEMALNIGLGNSHLGLPATLACISYYLDIQGRPVAHKMPTDIPYLTTFAPTIALVAGGENPEWAERAFNFALSEEWQSRVEGLGGKLPARPGLVSSSPIPDDAQYFPTLEDAANIPRYLGILREKLA